MLPQTVGQIIFGLVVIAVIFFVVFNLYVVDQRYRRPVWFLGKLVWIAGPGLTFIPKPFVKVTRDVLIIPDTATIVIQAARTKDNIPLTFKETITYQVDPVRVKEFLLNMRDGLDALEQRTHKIVVECAGATDYSEIQGHEEKFSKTVEDKLSGQVKNFGILISSMGISNIVIDDESTRDAMASVARTKQDFEAYKLLGEGITKIAASIGITPAELFKQHMMKQMNTDGKGGFGFIMDQKMDIRTVLSELVRTGMPATEAAPAGGGETATTAKAG